MTGSRIRPAVSTADRPVVDLSVPGVSASIRWAGYEIPIMRCAWCHEFPCTCPRTTRCICGGWLADVDGSMAEGVRAHQTTELHQAWRETNGL